MKVFKLEKRDIWHIMSRYGDSMCANASALSSIFVGKNVDGKNTYEYAIKKGITVSDFDDSLKLCKTCVGHAYWGGHVNVRVDSDCKDVDYTSDVRELLN